MERGENQPQVTRPRGASGCAVAVVLLIGLLGAAVAALLAWPYLTGTARRHHLPAVYHSDSPLLPPPEQSDEGH